MKSIILFLVAMVAMAVPTFAQEKSKIEMKKEFFVSIDSISSVVKYMIIVNQHNKSAEKTIASLRKIESQIDSIEFKYKRIDDKLSNGYVIDPRYIAAEWKNQAENEVYYIGSNLSKDINLLKYNSAEKLVGTLDYYIPALTKLDAFFEAALRVVPVEVEVIVVDSAGNQLSGFAVEAVCLYSPEKEVFNNTNNAKKKINPGTRIFTVTKGDKQLRKEHPVNANDANTWKVIFNL